MSGADPLLEVRGLIVEAGGSRLLDIPSLGLCASEVLSLVGPNGAGKSTLLLALSGISRPTGGEVLFRGRRIHDPAFNLEYRRRIALVFQEPLLFDGTVGENVATGLRIRGLAKVETDRRVGENLARFRIGHLRGRRARTLSGGEAQRTSLARALATGPELLLLDEPFAALDPPAREALLNDLEETLRQTGIAAVFATHDRLEALRLADRMAVMHDGRILQDGPPAEVMNRPRDEFVASFVGVETIIPGEVTARNGGSITVAAHHGEVEVVGDFFPGERVLLCIRPEQVTLSVNSPAGRSSARNSFPGVIERLIPLGHTTKVVLDCGFPLPALVTNHSVEELELRVGLPVTASVKATAIHVIRGRVASR